MRIGPLRYVLRYIERVVSSKLVQHTESLQPEYVFHVFQMTSEKSVLCPKYVEYCGIRMEYTNTYSKRGPKMGGAAGNYRPKLN